MRAFIAVPVPADVADVLAGLERPTVAGLRWTTPEQWHVTLRFLGEVDDPEPLRRALARVPGIVAGAQEAVLGPVSAWFPGRRVLHLPVRGVEASAAAVGRALAEEGGVDAAADDDDGRPFAGHLTLARMRGERPGPGRLAGLPGHAEWVIDSVVLMGSTLGPGGARYETLASATMPDC